MKLKMKQGIFSFLGMLFFFLAIGFFPLIAMSEEPGTRSGEVPPPYGSVTVETPTSYYIKRGNYQSGSVDDLDLYDGNELIVKSRWWFGFPQVKITFYFEPQQADVLYNYYENSVSEWIYLEYYQELILYYTNGDSETITYGTNELDHPNLYVDKLYIYTQLYIGFNYKLYFDLLGLYSY